MRDETLIVEWSSGEPVYEQIARQIRARVAAGDLPPGTPLPPVRTLASDLGVNLNTVARAYRLLEEEGFLRIRDRSGAEVAPPAPKSAVPIRERLEESMKDLLARMRQAGVTAEEIRRLMEKQISAGAPARNAEDEAHR
jgi:GntR family transcriptional regulator